MASSEGEKGYWKDKLVLITGAGGFVGSAIASRLVAEGATVFGLVFDKDDRACQATGETSGTGMPRLLDGIREDPRFHPIPGDVRDFDQVEGLVRGNDIETIFHVAAQALVGEALARPRETLETNIMGTVNVLEAARLNAGRVKAVVVASSDKAYGIHKKLPYTEDMALHGEFPYEVSKSCADLACRAYFHSYGTPVAIARCANVFGGGDTNLSRLVPGTIVSVLQGKAPVLRSNGEFIRDFLYIDDAVDAYLLLARKLELEPATFSGEAFNFSQELRFKVIEVVQKILRLMGREDLEPVILDNANKEIRDQYLSCKKAREMLGWFPSSSFDDALERTVAWYREHTAIEDDNRRWTTVGRGGAVGSPGNEPVGGGTKHGDDG